MRKQQPHENLPTPGKPSKIDNRTHTSLVQHAVKDRQQPLVGLRREIAPTISVRMVKWVLAEENVKKC
jgi:hypothetical protein